MYTFIIKNNKTDVELALTRAMMAIAAVAAYVYPNPDHYYLSYGLSALLFVVAIFIKAISKKLPGGKWAMLLLAAAILYFTSGDIGFPLVLFVYGAIIKFLVIDPVVTVDEKEVVIKRNYVTSNHPWADLNNVILKDGLLSVDLKTNTVKYFTITDDINELEFNRFCNSCLGAAILPE